MEPTNRSHPIHQVYFFIRSILNLLMMKECTNASNRMTLRLPLPGTYFIFLQKKSKWMSHATQSLDATQTLDATQSSWLIYRGSGDWQSKRRLNFRKCSGDNDFMCDDSFICCDMTGLQDSCTGVPVYGSRIVVWFSAQSVAVCCGVLRSNTVCRSDMTHLQGFRGMAVEASSDFQEVLRDNLRAFNVTVVQSFITVSCLCTWACVYQYFSIFANLSAFVLWLVVQSFVIVSRWACASWREREGKSNMHTLLARKGGKKQDAHAFPLPFAPICALLMSW